MFEFSKRHQPRDYLLESSEVPPGNVSNYLHDKVKENDTLSVAPPCGNFFLNTEKIITDRWFCSLEGSESRPFYPCYTQVFKTVLNGKFISFTLPDIVGFTPSATRFGNWRAHTKTWSSGMSTVNLTPRTAARTTPEGSSIVVF